MLEKIRAAFVAELSKDDNQIDLAKATLLMAGYLRQNSEIVSYLRLLDDIANSVQPALQSAGTDLEIVKTLNRYLFSELNFYGNSRDYYEPGNSFLNKVLDSRRGIPISLSVIYLEVGWRLDLPLWGIGMPGHFIVGYGSQADPIYIDVFNQGRLLSEADCLQMCNVSPSSLLTFKENFLRPVAKKAIIYRMLLNLKQIYMKREDWESTYNVVDLMVVTQPDEITDLRDRGLLANRLERLHDAIFDIKRYLFMAPKSIDAGWLEERLEIMEEKLLRLN